MRAYKNIFVIIIVLALCAGILIIYLNDQGGSDGSASVTSGSVVINEFMASNGGCVIDDKGDNSDWIEIYNSGSEAVNLSGMGLSDDETSVKWVFPSITLEAGGYLVVFASGNSENDPNSVLHTNFKLSAEDGGIYITNAAGNVLDAVEYEEQVQNVSTGRTVEDINTWSTFDSPTPGYSNDETGVQAFQASRYADDSTLLITEVMADNKTTLADNNGIYSDYIEIYNAGTESLNLSGYGLSDDSQNVLDWKFPEVTIQPGAYLVLFASGKGSEATDLENGAIHTGFSISSYEEVITLATPMGLILDQITVIESQADTAYVRTLGGDGAYTDEWTQSSKPSPGYANTDDGYEQFVATNSVALGDIVISEVMTSNSEYLPEDDGGTYDWIELYNRGSEAVNLADYGLTDNTGNPAKFRLSDVTLEPGAYYTVLASGLANDDSLKKNYVHTNFKLNAAGEVLALFNADGVLQDKYNIDTLPDGVSMGRMPQQDGIFYFTEPTPNAANVNPSVGFVADPSSDIPAGSCYASGQTVTLTCATQGASIYYTLDGTEPTTSSTLYTSPITMSQTGMIRARAFKDGYLDSGTYTATYVVGATHTLPVISIVTDPDNLFDEETGIYVLGPDAQLVEGSSDHYEVANYLERGVESERPASFEVFDESGEQVFEQDIAIRIQGGYSRDNQQKSFSIIARSEYGEGSMAYPFFSDLPYTEYKSIILRCGGQDQWYAKIKEATILSLIGGWTNALTQSYETYVVYLNGEYWGAYFMEEKRTTNFVAQHEDVEDPDSINLLVGSGTSSDSRHLINGTNEGYKELMNFVTTHDMSIEENYNYLAERLDTDSFMDEMIHEIYVANSDYYNMEFYQVPGGKWKQIFYDMCWAFGDPTHLTLSRRMDDDVCGSTMFNALLSYSPWKKAFLERFAQAMETFYTTDHVISTIDEVADSVALEIPAERAKFTDYKKDWDDAVESMRTFAKERPYEILKQLKSVFGLSGSTLRGYFDFSDDEMKNGFNLSDEQMQSLFG